MAKKLTDSEKSRERDKKEAAKENRRAASKAFFHRIKLYLPLFTVFLTAICVIALCVFLYSLLLSGRDRNSLPREITLELDSGQKNVKTSSVTRNGTLYCNFSELARSCGMSVSGDRQNLKFVSSTGEYAAFSADSRFCSMNGASAAMEAEALMESGEMWLPVSFVDSWVNGITVTVSDDGTYLGIMRDVTTEGDETSPVEITFLLKGNSFLKKIGDGSLPSGAMTLPGGSIAYTFANDLSNYYQYMNPADNTPFLKLINPSYRDDGTYVPEDLYSVANKKPGLSGLTMDRTAEKALEALFIEMYTAGYRDVYVNMAYRDYKTQKSQFDTYVYNEQFWPRTHNGVFSDAAISILGKTYLKNTYESKASDKKKMSLSKADAERVAMSYSAYPGTGDHQTGLSVDLVITTAGSPSIEKTEVYEWLQSYAYQFGFIERYPKGKEKITGFSYEPRHWRFVGQAAAAEIHSKGLCLEEYVAELEAAG